MLTGFALELWQLAAPQFSKIICSSFVKQISTGSLRRTELLNFLDQDEKYLKHFSAAVTCIQEKIVDINHKQALQKIKINTDAERLHLNQLLTAGNSLGLSDALHPNWQRYSSHIVQAAQHTPGIGLAAIFPCFLSFRELGFYFKSLQLPVDHPYREWIGFYTTDVIPEGTAHMVEMVNACAAQADAAEKEKIKKFFLISSQCEASIFASAAHAPARLLFWRGGLNATQRPVLDAARSYACSAS